jgi:hypothetical protein
MNSDEYQSLEKLKSSNVKLFGEQNFLIDDCGKYKASYQHGRALNAFLSHVNSRYLLICDPDFFVVANDWIDNILKHMQESELCFWGAPWHPRFYRKYRYFPCVHFMLIDLERLDPNELNFMPDLVNQNDFSSHLWYRLSSLFAGGMYMNAFALLLKNFFSAVYEDIKLRKLIETSHDTGYYIYNKYYDDNAFKYKNNALLMPYFSGDWKHLKPKGITPLQMIPFLNFLIPDKYSYIPKKKNYFMSESDIGKKLIEYGFDFFTWDSKPFAFHLRGFMNPNDKVQQNKDAEKIINYFFSII